MLADACFVVLAQTACTAISKSMHLAGDNHPAGIALLDPIINTMQALFDQAPCAYVTFFADPTSVWMMSTGQFSVGELMTLHHNLINLHAYLGDPNNPCTFYVKRAPADHPEPDYLPMITGFTQVDMTTN
ncbi:hypothetical protein BC828DRAFT_417224, partial [Blastocladiella britannica]